MTRKKETFGDDAPMASIPEHYTPILVVDDDEGLLGSIEAIICSAGLARPALISDSRRVVEAVRKHRFQLVLLDIIMPHIDGLRILKSIKDEFPDVECVIITAVDDVSHAVRAMALGAYDYLVKPIDKDKLRITVRNALERYSLRHGLAPFGGSPSLEALKCPAAFRNIVCVDEKMIRVLHQAETAGMADCNLVITGETGVGKELVARAVHRAGNRATGPFVPVNVAAVGKSLFEASFFGHEKGAFTGATENRKGFLEVAEGGTLFLDEIGELDMDLQAKLLRAVEQKQICRVGNTAFRNIDVRIIAATNRDLGEDIKRKRFRRDLFYRLTLFTIHVPALRDRRKDILPLAYHFLKTHARKGDKPIRSISPELEACLVQHDFPGNVRELENIIGGAVLRETTDTLSLASALVANETTVPAIDCREALVPLKEMEKRHVLRVLEAMNGNRTHAAKALGIGLRTLRRKLREYADQ